ncbi:Fe(3+) ABC transporter substrate-binding protein [Verrucomicrobiales bacterium]|nr:Fe(3+) ABC transporter substrate-binding protein [Verrucomicrobiales bacterium]MDB4662658.1 Fe(3+) ABC transporter substrate-binding protein [Verrucomicrobiales bacterium]MDC0312279.1 Fe(3+) ABC transporter substrate-binding protein [bacterium]
MKKFLLSTITIAALGAGSIFAGEITLYSHRHYESDDALYAKFTEASGIKVNVVKAGADELIERLKSEGENTKADIFMTADAARLHLAKEAGVLEKVESEVLSSRIPEHLRDADLQWFGFTMRARIFAYAKDRVKPEELSTYEALTDPAWKTRVLARSSSNVYNQSLIASIIAATDKEKATAWAKAVRGNMARPPQGSDRDQMRAMVKGLGDVAIVNTYYVGLLANSEDEADRKVANSIGIFFPNQDGRGTHANVSGGGLIKNSDNKADAIKFLEFLASDEAQKSFPTTTYEYPVVEGIEWSDLMKSWGKFKMDELNLTKLGELNSTAVEAFNEAGWE